MQKNSFGAQQSKRRKRTTNRTGSSIALLCALLGICSMPSWADETTPVVRNYGIRIFSVGPRREYGMISECSGFCTSLSEWSAT